MSFSKITALTGVAALVSTVAAHGIVSGVVADGVYYQGYSPNFQYMQTQPVVVGWSIPQDQDNGFIAPSAFGTADVICHKGATNAQTSAKVAAGGTVELQWTVWPESHHGPVIDYLANCNGDCTTVDKTGLEFFKIDGVGLLDDTTVPGNWGSDTLIANNNSWTVTIPSDIAPGNYVLRHEIIALHSAGNADGAQAYPQCVNLEITGSGTATPAGTLGTALYTSTDPGILVNIYQTLTSYIVPGPALYSGGAAGTVPTTSAASTPSATNIASGVDSSPDAPSTSSTSIIAITTASAIVSDVPSSSSPSPSLSTSFTRFQNTTVATTPVPTTVPVVTATVLPVEELTVTIPITSSKAIPTSKPDVTLPAASNSVSTPTEIPSEQNSTALPTPTDFPVPSGTTLNDILAWISSFFEKYGKSNYTGSTVSRRHARDLAAADKKKREAEPFNRFQGFNLAGTGVGEGFALPTGGHPHHYHPHGTGFQGLPTATGLPIATGGYPTVFPTDLPVARL